MEKKNKKVIIFGAGISGLSAAHEFVKKGFQVDVYETNSEAGGFFRSARRKEDEEMPSEYSWHGIGPWYHNFFDIMKDIPDENGQSLFDTSLSRPINFGVAPNIGEAQFDNRKTWFVDVKRMFRLTTKDKILGTYLILKVWCSRLRSEIYYSTINAKEAWGRYLTKQGLDTWCACFGPWIGSDWKHVSLHQAGHFFRKQLITKPTYFHKADSEGPVWKQGARSGWLLLKGPSNEFWFSKWVNYLKTKKVNFFWNTSLVKINDRENKIISCEISNGQTVTGDIFILAINPFSCAKILAKSMTLKNDDELKLFAPLTRKGPHTQVSFRIGFAEKILWPTRRCALVLADSSFDITLFAQEQAWSEKVFLGRGIKSLWTGTACISSEPGSLYHQPLENCTKEQFIEEVMFQIKASEALDKLVKKANGKSWKEFKIERIEVWHEWIFSTKGIQCRQPKWVNSTDLQTFLPKQQTGYINLALAGAHTKTAADLWSIEAAVESGRRAAKVFISDIKIIPQYVPGILKIFQSLDDILFQLKMPHILDLMLIELCLIILYVLIRFIIKI